MPAPFGKNPNDAEPRSSIVDFIDPRKPWLYINILSAAALTIALPPGIEVILYGMLLGLVIGLFKGFCDS